MANININLSAGIIQSSFSDPYVSDALQLSGVVDMFFQTTYGFDTSHYYYSSRSINGSELRLNYMDGAYSQFSGVKLANPNAAVGDATASTLQRAMPGYLKLTIGGSLDYHYDSNQGSFYATSSVITDASLNTELPVYSPFYDPETGNVSVGLHGRVAVTQSNDFSGTLNSINLSMEKLLSSATIEGAFTIRGNGVLVGQELTQTELAGRLDNLALKYTDGSVFTASGLGIAVTGSTDIDETLLANAANFAGDDQVSVTLAANLGKALQLATGAGNDKIRLQGGGTTLGVDAGSGNDVITLGDDNHRVDGGSGVDLVALTGPRSLYQFSQSGNTMTLQSKAFNGGVDTLLNVERLHFDDATFAFDIAGNAGQIYRLYQAAFNRTPDSGGLGYWIQAKDNGLSLDQIASHFTDSAEFQSMYGSHLSNAALVDKLYQNVLHRAGDAGGVAYWVDYLDHRGGTQAQTLAYFGESVENQSALAPLIGNGFSYTPYG